MQRIYALIGKPVEHSLSADYFNDLFNSQGIGARYILQGLDGLSVLRPWLKSNPTIVGLNVTNPYGVEVCNYLDHIDPETKYVRAVNTIIVDHTDGWICLFGYNTGIQDVVETLRPPLTSEQQHALILGTGGAAQAVAQALKRLGRDCTLISRDSQAPHILSYSSLTPELITGERIVINTAPVGMEVLTMERPQIPYEAITLKHLCIDLICNPEETRFLKARREQRTTTISGLKMLLVQARYVWHIWSHQA